MDTDPSAFPVGRQALADELRRLRVMAGLTTREMAKALGVSQAKISQLEGTHRGAPPDDVIKWALTVGLSASEAKALGEEALRVAADVSDWRKTMRALGSSGMAGIQREWAAMEAAAPILREHQALIVPGLLQTAEYARRTFAIEDEDNNQDIAAAASARVERQSALYDTSKRFEFIVSEAALRWRIGPPESQAAQLDRIRQIMTLPSVYLGILPVDIEAPIWRYHPFVMLDTPEGQEGPAEVFVELLGQNARLDRPDVVERYRRVFRQLQQAAVTGADALALLDRLANLGPPPSVPRPSP